MTAFYEHPSMNCETVQEQPIIIDLELAGSLVMNCHDAIIESREILHEFLNDHTVAIVSAKISPIIAIRSRQIIEETFKKYRKLADNYLKSLRDLTICHSDINLEFLTHEWLGYFRNFQNIIVDIFHKVEMFICIYMNVLPSETIEKIRYCQQRISNVEFKS